MTYYYDENGNLVKEEEKKKKKKNQSQSQSSYSYKNGELVRTVQEDDISYDDIAPVKGGNKNSVFKSGGFSDGVDGAGDFFGDLGQTVLGTTADLGLGILKGAGRLVEGVVDLGTYGVAGVADLFGADKFAEKTKKVAQYSATDEWTKGATDYVDQYSVLGNKADMVSEGIGQVGAIILTGGAAGAAGLGTAGATALTTGLTGLSGMGSGMSEAYEMGASDGSAVAYGATVGTLEAVSEMIFGGLGKGVKALGVSKGLTSIDDIAAKRLSNAAAKFITSEAGQKVVGNTLEYAVKSGAEGLEEVISGFGSAIAKDAYLMNGEDEKAFGEILKDENLLEQFVVGSIVSGIAQGGDFISSTKNGRDFVSGLSKNEQTVVDKVYEQRLAEESENRTLSNRDKNKLYERVVEEMKRGYVTTDEIESILGGETYKGYKDLADKKKSLEERKKAIEEEIKSLVKTPESQFTIEQREKLTSLREEAKGIKEALQNLGIKTAKNNLFNEVNKLTAKDTFLRESYNDLIRQNQALQIDENQYNGTKFADAAKKTIENARKAKASNSIRVRDFVEFSAKYSSVSGTVVDFKDANQINKILEDQLNAKIATLQKSTTAEDKAKLAQVQEMLKDVQDGKIHVNGVKTKDGVAINLKSPNYLNVVLGHEVTHFLEGKNAYEPLQKAIFKYAQHKGDLDGRRSVLEALYENIDGTSVDYELTADLVGEYLFTEYDFIKNLSTEDRNVFQKVYDQIKYMFKLATAGSKEARELEKVMHQFERALRESAETSQNAEHNEAATQFSFSSIANTFHGDPDMPSMAFEKTDYKQTDGYKNYVEQCINNMRQTRTDFDESVARREIEEQIDGIVRVALAAKKAGYDIYDDATKRSKKDSKKRLLFSSLEPNSDYFTSSDISTECDKRKNFADIYDAIVKKEEAMGVPQGKRFFDNVDNYFYLHKVLADKGLTQPCRECYVESMRKNLAPMANAFLRLVNETDVNNKANDQLYHQDGKLKSNNSKLRNKVLKAFEANPEYNMTASDLTVEMLTTADGLAQLKIQAPLIYEAFNSFYGQSKPKMPKAATPFRFGELTALLTDHNGKINRKLVEKINSTGGFRLQSYSDFQIENFADVLQVIYEAGTLGLSGHAYTKVPAFLKATEGTNLKRNISIFMYKDGDEWKLDKNDSFPYELEEIYDIVNSDASGNTGIIAVSQNKDMSCWIMANDFIGYGIPFHKSGLKMDTVRDTDVQTDDGRIVKGYSETIDHTKQQTEVYADTETKVKKGINIYSFWDFNNVDNLSKNELIEKNVREYIKRCETAGYLPKFRDYVINNDSVLNDVLRYAKELGFVEQTATIDDISFKYEGKYHSYTIPYGYYKFLGDFNMFKPDGTASPHDTLSLNGYDFDAAERFFADAEGLRRNEILQQFANGEERQKYRDSDMDAEELTKIVKQKREEVVDSIVAPTEAQYSLSPDKKKTDADYMFAVKNGDTETAQRMVDEAARNAGYTRTLYHGTASKFNVFGFGRTGIFTTDNYDMAKTYGDNVISLYGKEGAKVLTIDAQESPHYAIRVSKDVLDFSEYPLMRGKELYSTNDISLIAFREGYDVVVINNVYDNYSAVSGNPNGLGTDVVYKDSNQVKSSEAITYDDNGNVIPLSERFNAENEDIRYSLSNEGEKHTLGGSYRFDGKDFRTPANETALEQDIAPVAEGVVEDAAFDAPMLEDIPILPDEELEQGTIAAIRPKPEKQPSMKRVNNAESKEHIAQVLTEEPKVEKKKKGILSSLVRNFVDKGAVFENLSLKTKNRALQDTYKAMGRSETKAQYFMENGKEGVKPLNDIIAEVEQTGKTKEFYEYLYHKHNVDRMSLESRERPNLERLTRKMNDLKLLKLQENQLRAIASEKITNETAPKRADLIKTVREYLKSKDVKNKPVFDYSVTAEMSQATANQLEAKNPDFKGYAQDVYDYMNHLRQMMVDKGVISQETADLWAETYPYYVPIRRAGHDGLAVNVPLDTNKTGINAPIKRATGGNSDILPLFETMAQRTLQTFKAIDKNRFGVELKNTLGNTVERTTTNIDEVIDSIDAHESLLQEGKNGRNPTFTVFENGERVTFDITDEMYDALKPTSEGLSYTNKVLNTASNLHRGVLTEYSVPFMVTNAIKDAQDVLINSQHPAQTYANSPVAIKELITKGKWYTEYMENGGGDNTYFDKQTNTFNKEKSTLRKVVGFPLDKISDANNFIEKVPRLAEYIASRKNGASIDAAMLDAARVTTDFSAGGDVTKFLNRNGATFLNASVQGFAQQVRNVREAKMNGLKGWLGLATKTIMAGLPAMLLNGLLWDDDEEYEELSDYVKENYYIVGKYGDGKFVRIPKGRALAVIQNGFEQIGNTLTGDDEADFGRFFELFLSNLAPNNPLDNNIIAPIKQVMENKTWYGEDLVPTRLQDLPAAEQYDESTDSISKWLGENLNVSPYKINYLLNQYSGGVGDIFLPMMTPEAESGDNSLLGNLIAPLKDKFTTDSVMNNQNVSDFYSKADELKVKANSSYATEEDILKNKYMNAVNSELGELYKTKREIQNSSLSDEAKYAQVREIQKQINALAKESLNTYDNVVSEDNYANVGDKHYKQNDEGEWQKINDKQVEKQAPFVKVYGGYSSYLKYSSDLYDIKADKDEYGKSISGSRKEKVLNYINNLDADYETKIILWKSEYPSDDTYNMDIINYLNNRADLTYEERVAILTELGFTVSGDTVYWD